MKHWIIHGSRVTTVTHIGSLPADMQPSARNGGLNMYVIIESYRLLLFKPDICMLSTISQSEHLKDKRDGRHVVLQESVVAIQKFGTVLGYFQHFKISQFNALVSMHIVYKLQ